MLAGVRSPDGRRRAGAYGAKLSGREVLTTPRPRPRPHACESAVSFPTPPCPRRRGMGKRPYRAAAAAEAGPTAFCTRFLRLPAPPFLRAKQRVRGSAAKATAGRAASLPNLLRGAPPSPTSLVVTAPSCEHGQLGGSPNPSPAPRPLNRGVPFPAGPLRRKGAASGRALACPGSRGRRIAAGKTEAGLVRCASPVPLSCTPLSGSHAPRNPAYAESPHPSYPSARELRGLVSC